MAVGVGEFGGDVDCAGCGDCGCSLLFTNRFLCLRRSCAIRDFRCCRDGGAGGRGGVGVRVGVDVGGDGGIVAVIVGGVGGCSIELVDGGGCCCC